MYERKSDELLSAAAFLARLGRHLLAAAVIVFVSLFGGAVGYHLTENFSWLDSFLNASMILGGMGPVNPIQTEAGKLFAIFYALFSGLVFLAVFGVVLGPVAHRFLHRFHLDEES